ncbi:hypothetical protein ScPMuIL_016857 [Solemya velum]
MDCETNNEYMNDFDDVEVLEPSHLSENSKDIDEEMVENVVTSEDMKEKGNMFYVQHQYKEALKYYSEAINLCPTCASYYGNRAATLIMLCRYKDALEDARQAVQLDATFIKGHLREGKCHVKLGEVSSALRSYQQALQLDPKNATAMKELQVVKSVQNFEALAEEEFNKGDFRTALFRMDRCLDQCTACVRFRVKKAELLSLLGRYQESQELANDLLRMDGMNPDAIYVRGMCLYYQDNVDKAFQHFQQVLRLAPDHIKAKETYKKAKSLLAKKEEGNREFRKGNYKAALQLYTDALLIDPNNRFTNSKLHFNKATVCSKIGQHEEAIQNCTKAIELDEDYLKAYLRRAKCQMEAEMYEEAVRDYEKILKMDTTRENKRLLQEAKLELKKSKRKDYYKLLGIGKTATDDEIKKAYKKRALIHHPDRHSHAEIEVQKEEEKTFKEVGEAYSVLSDSKKRARYDNGQDLEDMDGHGFADVDPNQIFQAFFGGGGGQSFSFSSGGFPSGFSFQFG